MSYPTLAEPPIAERTVEVRAAMRPGFDEILTPEALAFLAMLQQRFEARRRELLQRRQQRQAELDAGALPDFLAESRAIRESDWQVAPIPADLQRRRVEITGPVERKMVINALNSGADLFMADFEDSNAPTWDNIIEGQRNLRDAVRRTIEFTNEAGKQYRLGDSVATLMVRPRGWHLPEAHLTLGGEPLAGALVDFGLFFFHNAQALVAQGSGPYFYLPKLEGHLEARLWNDVFVAAQEALGLPRGTIRATVLIETILAAFEMDEILWELREHSAGLNCGRWDYIFSVIKKFRNRPEWLLPDRAQVTMATPMMRAYSLLTIQRCHRRGIHAMGGMAAQIPIKSDAAANEAALAKVRADKEREMADGHDGTWVAHPGLVPIALAAFEGMAGPNQLTRTREELRLDAAELLAIPEGTISEAGVRTNINVGVLYLAAWLSGNGCVPLYHLMEDAATAEISRAQLWQWVHHGATLADGRTLTAELFDWMLHEEMAALRAAHGEAAYHEGNIARAGELFHGMTHAPQFDEFLTLAAYPYLVRINE